MKKLEVKDLKENFFEAIGKEWMLVTAGTKEKFNTMTASWGGIGWLWNKPVAFVFVRPERYTYEFIEKSDYLTLSFLGEANKKIHAVCGSKSGRDTDKVKATGDTLLVQMVKMVMADKQVINFCKNVGIGRKLTLSFHKRDVSENRIEHDSFACQLKEEGIMSQPY